MTMTPTLEREAPAAEAAELLDPCATAPQRALLVLQERLRSGQAGALAPVAEGALRVDACAWVAWVGNPMAPQDMALEPLRPGAPLASVAPMDGGAWACWAGGQWLPRSAWAEPARPGELVVFVQVAGGRGIFRAVLTLAVIAAAVYFGPALGASIGNSLGLTLSAAQATALGSAVIQVAGSLIVNALVPLRAAGGGGSSQAASPNYSVALQGNSPRLGQPVPVGYGTMRTFPDIGCAYTEFAGDSDQFYNAVLVVGLGMYQILNVEIGDTNVLAFQDVQVRYWGPGQSIERLGETLSPQGTPALDMLATESVGGQELDTPQVWLGAFTPLNAGMVASSREVLTDIVFVQGLADINPNDGEPRSLTVNFELSARPIDDRGQPTEGWVPLVWAGATTAPNTTARVTAASRSPRRYSLSWRLPDRAGQELQTRWEFRMRRTSFKSTSQYKLDSVQWAGLRMRGRLRGKPLAQSGDSPAGMTGITLRIRASEQLSGLSQRRVAVYWRRLLPVWRGASFSAPVYSDSPVDVATDILCNEAYGRALPVRALDMAGLGALRETLAQRQDRCSYVFDTLTTAHEAASLALRCGRAALVQRMGRITSVRDEPQAAPVAMFTPQSMQADSLVLSSVLPAEDEPLSVRMTYLDNQVWAERAAVAIVTDAAQPGVWAGYAWLEDEGPPLALPPAVAAGVLQATAPDRVVERPLPGVTGRMQALREALFAAGVQRLRRENLSFGAGLEGLLVAWGDAVLVAHDVVDWGQSAEVAHWDAETRTLTASEPLSWQAGAAHFVRLLQPTGEPGASLPVQRGLADDELVLDAAPAIAPLHDDPLRERTRLIFGPGTRQGMEVRLQTCAPAGGELVNLGGYVEVPAVHGLDTALLPAAEDMQDLPSTGAANVASGEGDENQGDVVFLSDFAGVQPLVDASGLRIPITLTDAAVLVNEPAAGQFGGRAVQIGGSNIFGTEGGGGAHTGSVAAFAFGALPWTWECYAKFISLYNPSSNDFLLGILGGGTTHGVVSVAKTGRLVYSGGGRFASGNTGANLAVGQTYHLAVVFDGLAISLFVNGTRRGEPVTMPVNMPGPGQLVLGGRTHYVATVWGIRLTANMARYGANFTPGGPWPVPQR